MGSGNLCFRRPGLKNKRREGGTMEDKIRVLLPEDEVDARVE